MEIRISLKQNDKTLSKRKVSSRAFVAPHDV